MYDIDLQLTKQIDNWTSILEYQTLIDDDIDSIQDDVLTDTSTPIKLYSNRVLYY